MIVVAVVLDERRRRGNVAALHRRHAGGSRHRRSLAVQVEHSGETPRKVTVNTHTQTLTHTISFPVGHLAVEDSPFVRGRRDWGQRGTGPLGGRLVLHLVLGGTIQCQINNVHLLAAVSGGAALLLVGFCPRRICPRIHSLSVTQWFNTFCPTSTVTSMWSRLCQEVHTLIRFVVKSDSISKVFRIRKYLIDFLQRLRLVRLFFFNSLYFVTQY